VSEPPASQRTRICLTCRTLYDEGESCPGPKHATVSLRSEKGRRQLGDEVWGPDSRARKLRQATRAGAGGAGLGGLLNACDLAPLDGCTGLGEGIAAILAMIVVALVATVLFHLTRALVRWIREKLDRPKPHGALSGAPKPKHAVVAASGVVRSGTPLATPWKAGNALAYAMELFEKRVFGGGAMLRDARTAGFEVQLDDGRLLHVPAGRLRIVSRLEKVDVDRSRLGDVAAELGGRRDAAERALFPFDHARGLTVGPGDRVDVLGEVETSPDATTGYRAAEILKPVGVPVLRVRHGGDEARVRIAEDAPPSERNEAEAGTEDERDEPEAAARRIGS
jgi:hypothetical protein